MKRRDLIVGGATVAAGAAAGMWWLRCGGDPPPPRSGGGDNARNRMASDGGPARDDASRPRPNVLMVAIDDMKPWVGPHGFAAAHTPSLDALAKRGVVFRRAYCAAPACSPSRAAVFTGLPPHETGVYFNRHNWRDARPDAITLPRLLRDAGYYTAGYGKLFHGKRHDDTPGWDDRVFHKHLETPKQAPFNGLKTYWKKAGKLDWGPVDVPVETMDDHKQVDRAVAAMQAERDQPWFIACGIFRPHLPWYVPRQFFDLYPLDEVPLPEVPKDDLDDVPKRGRWFANTREHKLIVNNGQWREAVQGYLASISYADFELGRLLDGTPPDTCIVLWSDHGWHLGPKNHWQKYTLWEEAAQTVFAVAGPGAAEGKLCDRTVSLLDVYPTIAELCGVTPPTALAGRSVVPLAHDPTADWARPALTTYGKGNHSIRGERYRYIRYNDGGEELYDHDVDPHEWTNLAGTAGARPIIRELSRWLPANDADQTGKRRGTWLEAPGGRRVLVPA
jgi:arylsulfatase A-like enzyme